MLAAHEFRRGGLRVALPLPLPALSRGMKRDKLHGTNGAEFAVFFADFRFPGNYSISEAQIMATRALEWCYCIPSGHKSIHAALFFFSGEIIIEMLAVAVTAFSYRGMNFYSIQFEQVKCYLFSWGFTVAVLISVELILAIQAGIVTWPKFASAPYRGQNPQNREKRGSGQKTPISQCPKSPLLYRAPQGNWGFFPLKAPFLRWWEMGVFWPRNPLFPTLVILTPVTGGRNRSQDQNSWEL